MYLTLCVARGTPRGASRLVQAMSAWSMNARRAPFQHCKDGRVYGHTTTAMHDMRTPSPLPATPTAAVAAVLIGGLEGGKRRTDQTLPDFR